MREVEQPFSAQRGSKVLLREVHGHDAEAVQLAGQAQIHASDRVARVLPAVQDRELQDEGPQQTDRGPPEQDLVRSFEPLGLPGNRRYETRRIRETNKAYMGRVCFSSTCSAEKQSSCFFPKSSIRTRLTCASSRSWIS